MIKRLFDIGLSIVGLVLVSPILMPVLLLVWLQDFCSPFYIAARVGRDGHQFRMVKIRSMISDADRSGVDSTSMRDPRITSVGKWVRTYKLDELMQLWNVLVGTMSVVGPRPNVPREVALYTADETRLLSVKPGVTDFASIVFADEGSILRDQPDPDIAYHQLIRPWKSRLGLFYVEHRTFLLDLTLVLLTIQALLSRDLALSNVARLLTRHGAPAALARVASRREALVPMAPPGAVHVVMSRG